MGTLPQCNRLITSLTDETAYGTATVDGSLDTMYHLVDPVLSEPSLDVIDDTDLIKGHEFLSNPNAYKILFTNQRLSLSNIPASAEFLGWLLARAMGAVTTAEIPAASGDFIHTNKVLDKCAVGDQLPSATITIGWSGTLAVNRTYKGCIVESFTIRINQKGRVIVDCVIVTDGSEIDGSGVSIPAAFASTSFYFGFDAILKYEDFGTGLAVQTPKLRGFELTYNNNLLVDEAKDKTFATQATLPELRLGDRTIEANLTLLADEESAEYADGLSTQRKVVEVTVGGVTLPGSNAADLVILIPQAQWQVTGKGFDGSRRTITLAHKMYLDSTEGSPLTIKVTNDDTLTL